jgi:5S rRNA maturation endonuclease (ribonuclease M5)
VKPNGTAHQRLLDDLRNDGRIVNEDGGRAMAQCPAHDDTNPSLAITAVEGQVLVHCHAGCLTETVMKSLGRSLADLYDDRKGASYRYSDGRIVNRKANKTFSQQGNTQSNALYHVEKIGDATTVYVCEGEKDVLAVEAVGGTAVSSAMGAGKADKFDWTPLKGKEVIVIADNDQPGHGHARDVVERLDGIASSVKVVKANDGKDAADHIAAGHGLDEFVEIQGVKVEIPNGADLIEAVANWYNRFIACDKEDLHILALWTIHTHLAEECHTSPRLLLDSAMPGSGKTTVCDHMTRLACNAVHFASLSSPALLVRILQGGIRTLLIDEADRALSPDKPGVGELVAVINSGYRVGATRPVLTPQKGGGWQHEEMPTFAPVVLAGNSPRLADDTRSRCIRILLMPDLDGLIEDSDWEYLDEEAKELHDIIVAWADSVRDNVKSLKVDLPEKCRARSREKWRPLKRVAVQAGGDWPEITDELIERDLAEEAADREDGLRNLPPAVVVMTDLYEIWPDGVAFMGTVDLVKKLAFHNPEQWSEFSTYGKRLTGTRLGRMITQVAKVHSTRVEHNGVRGYRRADLEPAWHRLGIGR